MDGLLGPRELNPRIGHTRSTAPAAFRRTPAGIMTPVILCAWGRGGPTRRFGVTGQATRGGGEGAASGSREQWDRAPLPAGHRRQCLRSGGRLTREKGRMPPALSGGSAGPCSAGPQRLRLRSLHWGLCFSLPLPRPTGPRVSWLPGKPGAPGDTHVPSPESPSASSCPVNAPDGHC